MTKDVEQEESALPTHCRDVPRRVQFVQSTTPRFLAVEEADSVVLSRATEKSGSGEFLAGNYSISVWARLTFRRWFTF